MAAALQQQLAKLDVPGPVQQYAIAAVFDAACQGASAPPSPAAESALVRCLTLPSSQGAGVAADRLVDAVKSGKLGTTDAQSLLLSALAVAPAAAAAPLASAAVALWRLQPPATTTLPSWKAHLLSKALLACPAAGPELVTGACRAVASAAAGNAASFTETLNSLRPFIFHVLLDPGATSQHPQMASSMHGGLVRAAVGADAAPAAQHAVLRLLCSLLPALQMRTPALQAAAAACAADILDLLETCSEEPDEDIVGALVQGLVSLAGDAERCGGTAAPFLSALSAVAAHWPDRVLAAAPLHLALLAAGGSAGDAAAALALLSSLLESPGAGLSPAASAALSSQLVPGLAFGQVKAAKEWTLRALGAVQRCPSGPSAPLHPAQGALLLETLWNSPDTAWNWLLSLDYQLSAFPGAGSKIRSSSGGAPLAPALAPAAAVPLLALLHHPAPTVAQSALIAALAAVRTAPLLGLAVLPVLIHRLHILVESFLSGKKGGTPNALSLILPTLYALPRLAENPSAAPFVVRALQPLLAPPAPALLQAVALRALAEMWTTTGRGFPQLRTALLSYAAPAGGRRDGTDDSNPALRRAWAATLADVAAEDGARAAELVHSLSECFSDATDPAVQALGLEAVAELCEADILDFYKAWAVVKHSTPTLPKHPAPAAAWLRLLSSGALDAGVYPEVARGVVAALWTAAMTHPVAQVRGAAAAALAAYDFCALEAAEALVPQAWEFSALLQRENDPEEVPGCEELVVAVLRYEHATRRRQQQQRGGDGGGGAGVRRPRWARSALRAAGADASATVHRLASTLPRALLGGGSSALAEFLRRLPEVAPAAALLLWAPPPPPAGSSTAVTATATATGSSPAKQAAEAYATVFDELCRRAEVGGSALSETAAGAAEEGAAAWAAFIRRWVAASRDAEPAAKGTVSKADRAAAGTLAVWKRVKAALEAGAVGVAAAAAGAAGALAASAGPQPVKQVVEEVCGALMALAEGGRQGVAAQSAACTALGTATEGVRVVAGMPAAATILDLLRRHLADTTAPSSLRAAAAAGLGLACARLASAAAASPAAAFAVREALLLLLGAACTYLPRETSQAAFEAVWDPALAIAELPTVECPTEVADAALAALADVAPAFVSLGTIQIFSVLFDASEATLRDAERAPALASGAAALLRAAALSGFKSNSIAAPRVAGALQLLREMAETGAVPGAPINSGAPSGKLSGAAAASLGALAPALAREGFNYASSSISYEQCLASVAAAAAGAPRASGAAAAKLGAATGLAAALRFRLSSREDAGLSVPEKGALDALEALALKDEDTRSRRSAAAALARLCWTARQAAAAAAESGTDASTIDGSSAASATAAVKGVAALPETGALRFLCETALAGAWPAVDEAETDGNDASTASEAVPLTAPQAAAVLRCLAAAPRLPAADWAAACRRLLRAHPTSVPLQLACVDMVSAHAAVSKSLQLSDFVAADVFAGRGLSTWAPAAQTAILEALPRLLAAIPDAEATSVVRGLCEACPAGEEGGAWQAALLRGLAALLEGLNGRDAGTVAQEAWDTVFSVLPKIPEPEGWPLPLRLAPAPTGGESQALVPPGDPVWWALLRVALAAPGAAAMEALFAEAAVFEAQPLRRTWLAAALVANGGADLRGLQHPRNLVLNGTLTAAPGALEMVTLLAARALTQAPGLTSAQRQQWVMDVLHAAERCAAPEAAIRLAAVGAVALACAGSSGLAAEHGALVSCATALEALPESLRQIGEATEPVPVALLTGVARAVGVLAGGAVLQQRSCAALRHVLHGDAWTELCSSVDSF